MKILNISFLFINIGFIIICSNIEGADWKIWHEDTNGILFYYDAESIERLLNKVVRVSGKIVGSNVVIMNPDSKEIDKSYNTKKVPCVFEFNCSLKMYRMNSSKVEFENGRSEELKNPNSQWIQISSEPFFEPFYNAVCQ
jgi:hypothetical protein